MLQLQLAHNQMLGKFTMLVDLRINGNDILCATKLILNHTGKCIVIPIVIIHTHTHTTWTQHLLQASESCNVLHNLLLAIKNSMVCVWMVGLGTLYTVWQS